MSEEVLNRKDTKNARKIFPFVIFVPSWLAAIEPSIWAWVLVMICVPIAHWMVGESVIPLTATTTTVLQFTAVTVILWRHWGVRRTLTAFMLVAILTYAAEALGSKTDFPFGAYDYTPSLQPQLWNVPLLIPLAWWMMIVPAWAVAAAIVHPERFQTNPQRIIHKAPTIDSPPLPAGEGIAFILISAAALTAWDLFLDPQMVKWGFWTWAQPSGYFGIPFVNFFGWMLTAGMVTAIVRPRNLPIKPLLVIYGIVWALQSIGLAFFWNEPGPALFGFLAMGSLLALAIYRLNYSPVESPPPCLGEGQGGGLTHD